MSLLMVILMVLGLSGHVDTVRIEAPRCESEAQAGGPNGDMVPLYMTIYTPPSYHPDSVYPVLYLLHGIRGNQYSWMEQAHVAARVDSMIRYQDIRPLVVVMPLAQVHDSTYATQLPSYANAIHGYLHHIRHGEFEQYFPAIEHYMTTHYAVRKEGGKGHEYVIAGLSSGARQALNLSRTTHFDVVGLFSPVILRSQLPQDESGTMYWIRCGKRDLFYSRARKANRKMNRRHISHDYAKTKGRHTWQNWNQYIDEFLVFTFE